MINQKSIYNLGTGISNSIQQLITVFEKVNNINIHFLTFL